jgi:hypothetical protein
MRGLTTHAIAVAELVASKFAQAPAATGTDLAAI